MPKRKFSEEYKLEAVKLVVEGGAPVAQAARDLGLGQSTLEKWVAAWRSKNPQEAPLTVSCSFMRKLKEASSMSFKKLLQIISGTSREQTFLIYLGG